jgi:dTDP-4-amino-4,6-dideoxygalactose transaminase
VAAGGRVKIPITRPYFTDAEARAVAEVLESGWVSQGPRVAEFEQVFATHVGAAHAVATTSATTALHLMLVAQGIGPGDEVLVPSFTFVATANAVEYCGARPVFVDVSLETFNVDVDALASAVTARTRAIIVVHLFGLSADMKAIQAVATRHGLAVLEDAACGLGAFYHGRHVGSLGPPACFSFHPRKAITTGEGGMITTGDAELAGRLRSLRSHAATVSDVDRHAARGFLLPRHEEVGFNYRMTDLQAAVGLAQMQKVDEIQKRRAALADAYRSSLADVAWLRLPAVPEGYVHGYQAFVTLVAEDAPCDRDTVAARLEEAGVATRPGTHAAHAVGYYRTRYGLLPEDLPASWAAERRSLALPLYATMTEAELEYVVGQLRRLA